MIVPSPETAAAAALARDTDSVQPEPAGTTDDRHNWQRAHPYLVPEQYRRFADDFDWGLI